MHAFDREHDRIAPPVSVLWIDDEVASDDPLLRLLALDGVRTDVAPSGAAGLAMSRESRYDAILLDLRLPDLFGLTVLERLIASDWRTPVVVVTAYYLEPELRADAIRRGAAAFQHKPFFGTDDLLVLLRSVIRPEAAEPPDPSRISGIVAASPPMRSVIEWIDRVGPTSARVLLTGETGTGKELVARALHRSSPRRSARFVPVNCAAIPEALVESELFGHRKGSFTGAVSDKKGLFEIADGGTLFLDEIGDLPLAMQGRLLRCLDDGEVRRVGETRAQRVDVRVIAATNRELPEEVTSGRFRRDLYYRLSVASRHLPPLRTRPEDVDALVRYWLPRIPAWTGVPVTGITPEALTLLRAHHWPGNVRELRHVLERASLTAVGALLTASDVAEAIEERPAAAGEPVQEEALTFADPLSEADRRIMAALERHQWNRTDAARSLGISRSTLWRALKRLGPWFPRRD